MLGFLTINLGASVERMRRHSYAKYNLSHVFSVSDSTGLDPKEKIDNDTILDDFFESEYAKSEGYKQVDAQSSA